jgi:hypothetical protein
VTTPFGFGASGASPPDMEASDLRLLTRPSKKPPKYFNVARPPQKTT